MSELKIREMMLKPGRPKVAVPVVSQIPADIIEECENIKSLPCDMVEWRADYYLSSIENLDQHLADKHGYLDMVKILDDINYIVEDKPIIFTVRSLSQGGQVSLTKEQRESVYGLAAETGLVDIIDMELLDEAGQIDEEWLRHQIDEAHLHGIKVMLSHHDFEKTPSPAEMVAQVKKMYMMGADICKVATMVKDKADAEDLLRTTAFLNQNNIGPVVMLGMGEEGTATRVAAGRYGSLITFAAGKENSALGQVDTYTMKKWLDSYYAE